MTNALFDTIFQAAGPQIMSSLGSNLGFNQGQSASALGQLLPVISQGLLAKISQGGEGGLLDALESGQHANYIDNPQTLADDATTQDGNKILGHILGSKDASRAAAKQASESSGLDYGLLKKALPVVAAVAMGALAKSRKAAPTREGFSGQIGGLLGGLAGAGSSSGGLGSILSGLGGLLK